jgi:hypothetical protein
MVTRGIAPVAIEVVGKLVIEQTLARLLVASASQNARCQKRSLCDVQLATASQPVAPKRSIRRFVDSANLPIRVLFETTPSVDLYDS